MAKSKEIQKQDSQQIVWRNDTGRELRLPDARGVVKIILPGQVVEGVHWKQFFLLTELKAGDK